MTTLGRSPLTNSFRSRSLSLPSRPHFKSDNRRFATKLTHYVASCDPDELVHDMFNLLDQDGSGTITVHEMHNVVHEMLGQDLSVEDVFNVVQDIDVDGNGELDMEEFSVLLERFGIYH